ncbi:chaplin family protein [Actinoplanes sp. RD1]|uniref:chaplin family protein n=1 Tax=Actinoplanes sp. RD1 TaxID=3064538 RepID=UPI0027404F06|nr:chaplin family protein [Actinoplanes sp. RD1]
MKTWARKTLSIGVLAAGALLLAPAAAQADDSQTAVANHGILSGNNTVIDLMIPVNIAGNGIGVAGEGQGAGSSANYLTESGKRGDRGGNGTRQVSAFNRGIGSGNNTYVPVQLPINIVGNGVGVLGYGEGRGAAANHLRESGKVTEGGHNDRDRRGGRGGDQVAAGNGGVLSGNNTSVPVTAPINICGNGVGILGFGDGRGACANYVEGAGNGRQVSAGNRGIGSGNNTSIPVFAPINVNGNAVGNGEGRGAGKNDIENGRRGNGGDRDQLSVGNRGILSGNNTSVPITAPINICGNGIGLLGYGEGAGSCLNDLDGDRGGRGGRDWDNDGRGNGGHGHHGNGGNKGDDDNDGDHGHGDGNYGGKDDDDVLGDGGTQGGGKYGDSQREKKAESSALEGLTQNITNAGGSLLSK